MALDSTALIASSIDHLLFLIGLLLLGGGWRAQIRVMSTFILAHGLAFFLAASGGVILSSRITELCIALSLVVVAVENALVPVSGRGAGRRFALASIFGLVHGFGFAGALQDVGMIHTNSGILLTACNTAIELGVVAVVYIAAPRLSLLTTTHTFLWRSIRSLSAAVIAFIGAYWFTLGVLGSYLSK